MDLRCAECRAAGKPNTDATRGLNEELVYVHESKKVLCPKCLGRLMTGSPSTAYSIETIDDNHTTIPSLTAFILNAFMLILFVAAFWWSTIWTDYVKGNSCCPSTSFVRRSLLRFDANLFFYHKSNLSMYCDIEDSYWRFLLDAWSRTIVTGSDSLLLFSTPLPKALLFKSVVLDYLFGPICAVLLALVGMLLSTALDSQPVDWLRAFVKGYVRSPATRLKGYGATALMATFTLRLIGWLEKGRIVCLALSVSSGFRLVVRALGWSPFVQGSNTTNWQLILECFGFVYVAREILKFTNSLKIKKKPILKGPVLLTEHRDRPSRDYMERLDYEYDRLQRTFNFYRSQVQEKLHMLIDNTFNVVIFIRLTCIVFSSVTSVDVSCMFRFVLRCLPFTGALLDRHGSWFRTESGFSNDAASSDMVYWTDRIFSSMIREGGSFLQKVGSGGFQFASLDRTFCWSVLSTLWELMWRLLIPSLFFFGYRALNEKITKQKKQFAAEWQGTPAQSGKDGLYFKILKAYGSFWMVGDEQEWTSPFPGAKAPTPPPATKQADLPTPPAQDGGAAAKDAGASVMRRPRTPKSGKVELADRFVHVDKENRILQDINY